jgi:hypothetical protein
MRTNPSGHGTTARSEYWRERIVEQERSGLTVHRFCEERGLSEPNFYIWRKRLRKRESEPVRFALVETSQRPREAGLELVLATGERLRISAGVDVATLRSVLAALRG